MAFSRPPPCRSINVAELKDVAEQFAKDLMNQNITGLMMAMTPAGMTNAMALQAQRQAAGQTAPMTGFEVVIGETKGDDHMVDLVMKSAEGEGVIESRWRDVAGLWKVDGLTLKAT